MVIDIADSSFVISAQDWKGLILQSPKPSGACREMYKVPFTSV